MKLSFTFLIAAPALLFIFGCNRSNKATEQQTSVMDTSKQECYIAIYEKDTAYVNLNAADTKNVAGRLLIQYGNNPKNDGDFQGKFQGDTLFADYTYTVGTYKDRIVKNPVAFLKKNDSLILGIGEIETKVGRSYFKPGTRINFEKGRFRFVKTTCK